MSVAALALSCLALGLSISCLILVLSKSPTVIVNDRREKDEEKVDSQPEYTPLSILDHAAVKPHWLTEQQELEHEEAMIYEGKWQPND